MRISAGRVDAAERVPRDGEASGSDCSFDDHLAGATLAGSEGKNEDLLTSSSSSDKEVVEGEGECA